MITEEKLKEFMNELTDLSHKYGVIIDGGHDAPYLYDEDQYYNHYSEYGCYTAGGLSYDNSKKRYTAYLNTDLYNKPIEEDEI